MLSILYLLNTSICFQHFPRGHCLLLSVIISFVLLLSPNFRLMLPVILQSFLSTFQRSDYAFLHDPYKYLACSLVCLTSLKILSWTSSLFYVLGFQKLVCCTGGFSCDSILIFYTNGSGFFQGGLTLNLKKCPAR